MRPDGAGLLPMLFAGKCAASLPSAEVVATGSGEVSTV